MKRAFEIRSRIVYFIFIPTRERETINNVVEQKAMEAIKRWASFVKEKLKMAAKRT